MDRGAGIGGRLLPTSRSLRARFKGAQKFRFMSLTDLQRAALQMLAKSPRGYALSTAVARGFSFEMLQGLVRVGYATAHRDAVGMKKEKLPHLRITEAGRRAILRSP